METSSFADPGNLSFSVDFSPSGEAYHQTMIYHPDHRRHAGWASWPQATLTVGVLVCAASMLVFGVWAFAAPRSFADIVDFAPYNRHLTHDVGAFQVGIGVSLLVALLQWDGLRVALTGFITASALHTVSHFEDRNIGGHASDVAVLAVLTVAAVAVAAGGAGDARRRS
jgi:hypothetical protein